MKRYMLTPKFVETIPRDISDGVLFISEHYGTAIHKCCCGCGREVVTPLSPAKWQLRRHSDDTVTLYPSIGSWNFPCRSHYWVRHNRVEWSYDMSEHEIRAVQQRDHRDIERQIRLANSEKLKRNGVSGHDRHDDTVLFPVVWLARVWRWIMNWWNR